MFYNQPLSTRFGTNLITNIESGKWTSLDIAVAWIRASGLVHLEPAFSTFLRAGNELRVTVGVDLENTTKEGLANLLVLKQQGSISVFVHHNESGTIFHPKLYLFRNATDAKLIVASNNITQAGLYQNTEAGLELDASIGDQIIVSAMDALESWRDTGLNLARELDSDLLDELVNNGYVHDEATLRAQSASRRAASGARNGSGKKLFGGVAVTPPERPTPSQSTPPAAGSTNRPSRRVTSASSTSQQAHPVPRAASPASPIPIPTQTTTGQVLLMRVRKARGTQVQIPLAVIREAFFTGVTQVFSVAGSVTRGIHPTHPERAKGKNPNTLKLEMPETRSIEDPVARFERTATGIQYEVYDVKSAQGKAMMQSLQAGRISSPPATKLSIPSDPDSSTWWRFI